MHSWEAFLRNMNSYDFVRFSKDKESYSNDSAAIMHPLNDEQLKKISDKITEITEHFDEVSKIVAQSEGAKKDLAGILKKTANEWKFIASLGGSKIPALPEKFLQLQTQISKCFPEIIKNPQKEYDGSPRLVEESMNLNRKSLEYLALAATDENPPSIYDLVEKAVKLKEIDPTIPFLEETLQNLEKIFSSERDGFSTYLLLNHHDKKDILKGVAPELIWHKLMREGLLCVEFLRVVDIPVLTEVMLSMISDLEAGDAKTTQSIRKLISLFVRILTTCSTQSDDFWLSKALSALKTLQKELPRDFSPELDEFFRTEIVIHFSDQSIDQPLETLLRVCKSSPFLNILFIKMIESKQKTLTWVHDLTLKEYQHLANPSAATNHSEVVTLFFLRNSLRIPNDRSIFTNFEELSPSDISEQLLRVYERGLDYDFKVEEEKTILSLMISLVKHTYALVQKDDPEEDGKCILFFRLALWIARESGREEILGETLCGVIPDLIRKLCHLHNSQLVDLSDSEDCLMELVRLFPLKDSRERVLKLGNAWNTKTLYIPDVFPLSDSKLNLFFVIGEALFQAPESLNIPQILACWSEKISKELDSPDYFGRSIGHLLSAHINLNRLNENQLLSDVVKRSQELCIAKLKSLESLYYPDYQNLKRLLYLCHDQEIVSESINHLCKSLEDQDFVKESSMLYDFLELAFALSKNVGSEKLLAHRLSKFFDKFIKRYWFHDPSEFESLLQVISNLQQFIKNNEQFEEFEIVSSNSLELDLSAYSYKKSHMKMLARLKVDRLILKSRGWFEKEGLTSDEKKEVSKLFPFTTIEWK